MTEVDSQKVREVEVIAIDRITVLNPAFATSAISTKWSRAFDGWGYKATRHRHPPRRRGGPTALWLVCGQGRLEACTLLGQRDIPAIIIDAAEAECLVMSLVENCARRQHRAIDLLQDIQTLGKRGYSDGQIAHKIGVGPEWVNMIQGLLAKGEQRLLVAVESGTIPISVAVEISRTDDNDLQALMTQAYTEGKVTGSKLIKLRWILERRKRIGRKVAETPFGRTNPARRPTTTDALIRVYRQEARPPAPSGQEGRDDRDPAPIRGGGGEDTSRR